MNAVLILFVVGVLLLAAEALLPGAVLGILGGLCLAAGSVVSFFHFGTSGGLIATALAVVFLGLALFLEFYLLPRTKLGKQMFVQETSGVAAPAPGAGENLLGRPAEALTILAPGGYVLVDGKRYEAFCKSGHAAQGAQLKVCGGDNFRLIVSTL
jgi:membrane-bound ClpP family serine protease